MRITVAFFLIFTLVFFIPGAFAIDGNAVGNVTDKISKHYDPGHNGHVHKCKSCGASYNQPGDNGSGSIGTYRCPQCGYNNSPAQPTPNPQPNPNPVPQDPTLTPEYKRGYERGYQEGFGDAYRNNFDRGRRAGEVEGRENGLSEGYNNFVSRYDNYSYTDEKLKDLIDNMKMPRGNQDKNQTKSFNIDLKDSTKQAHGYNHQTPRPNNNYHRQGYNEGLRRGREEGRQKGYWDGRSETYDKAYSHSYSQGRQKAEHDFHFRGGNPLTMADQFQIAMEHNSRGKKRDALRRFNLILLEEAHNAKPSFRYQALWFAGEIYRAEGDEKLALKIFLLHRSNRPSEMQEESLLNIATLLLEVKTGGFIGIGSTKYYDKAKTLVNTWLKKYTGGARTAEALYTLGQCCEKLKQKEEAKSVYTRVKKEYPNSSWAEKAKKRLKKLNSWWGR